MKQLFVTESIEKFLQIVVAKKFYNHGNTINKEDRGAQEFLRDASARKVFFDLIRKLPLYIQLCLKAKVSQ